MLFYYSLSGLILVLLIFVFGYLFFLFYIAVIYIDLKKTCFERTVNFSGGNGMGGVGGLLKICMFLCKDEMMKNYNDSNKNNIEKIEMVVWKNEHIKSS